MQLTGERPAAGQRRLSRAGRQRLLYALLAAPGFLLLAIVFAYPLVDLMRLSIENGTLAHYEEVFSGGLYVGVFWNTVRIAGLVTLLCAVLGYPVAHFLATAPRGWALFGLLCVVLPFWTSLLVRTYAWMILLGNNGIINKLLVSTGLIQKPLPLLHNEFGVVVGMVHVLLPYFVFPVYAVMLRVDRNLMAAAEGLGAPMWQVLRRIYLPLTMPGVVAGATLVFILALGFFITPALLGGGKVMMVALLIEQQVAQMLNWGLASALCMVLVAAILVSYAAIKQLGRSRTA
ncbi:putative spermidine/putrescine transport system permease protein [Stella humosa]|uniref:Putative spermidine/putrescine transport system permease protein n=1 Tax=Stella humosa TaxID=94 RepID=A0A3N1KXW9_9PROT|nr:ABC transporter permease [Stella humosa]ROP84272.1 putative spermidine/putrescine transport system permease protein [Stella humosa]BBK33785.1 ABC transporter permease [Stella humosa]